jgi:hypothetical protein
MVFACFCCFLLKYRLFFTDIDDVLCFLAIICIDIYGFLFVFWLFVGFY